MPLLLLKDTRLVRVFGGDFGGTCCCPCDRLSAEHSNFGSTSRSGCCGNETSPPLWQAEDVR